jgi:WD40 repeat protein
MPTLMLVLALLAQDTNLTTLSGHTADVSQLAFSPDGKLLASSGADFVIRIWDLAAGKEVTTISGLKMAPEALAFSRDGNLIAAGLHSKIQIWDIAAGTGVASIETRFSPITRLAFANDGKTLLAGGPTGQVEVYDFTESKLLRTFQAGRLTPEFSADGSMIAAIQAQLLPFKDPVTGKLMGAASTQRVAFWDPPAGKQLRALEVPTGGIGLSPDGRRIAVVGFGGGRLLAIETGKEVGTFTGGETRPIGAPQFSAEGKTLCAPLLNRESVILWNAATLKERSVVETPGRRQSSVFISPDGKTLAWLVGRDIKVRRE